MNDLVARARDLSYRAHAGQVDKAGRPYIEHVARVAAAVSDDPEAEADLLATLDRARKAEARAERLAEAGQAMRDNLRCVLRVNCNCDDEFIDRQTAEWDAALNPTAAQENDDA